MGVRTNPCARFDYSRGFAVGHIEG